MAGLLSADREPLPRRAPPATVRVLFCWTEASGYMAACWRALARQPGVELHVVHVSELSDGSNQFLAEPGLLDGFSSEVLDASLPDIDGWLLNAVRGRRPEVIVVCGWHYAPYRRLLRVKEFRHVPVVVGMDSPWRGTWSQRLARFRLAGLVRRAHAVVTAGERSADYARRIGIAECRIRGGYYGFDHAQLSQVERSRVDAPGSWPRQFLFVGRYAPEKDLATLIKAYSAYRGSVSEPWGLTCRGSGSDGHLLEHAPGVTDAGFVRPGDLPAVLGRHGAFVLPSSFEPWGVVIAEAAASGLPVICTSACGAGIDLVRPYYNGLIVAPRDVSGLTRAMQWIHEHESDLPVMGQRGQALSEAYSAEAWAIRWHHYCLDVLSESSLPVA